MAKPSRIAVLGSVLVAATIAAAAPGPAAAQQPTCVTLCQQKVDSCAAECEALADAVYSDPASLRECQLACARQLFVGCVERCSETGEVSEGGYGIVAERPDRLPPSAPSK